MTFGRYLEGLVYIGLAFVPVGAASCAWRARLLPGWTGAAARLAEIVIGLGAVVCISEALGALHLFRTSVVVPALALVGAAGWYAGRRGPKGPAGVETSGPIQELTTRPSPRGAVVAATAAVAIVAADWGTRTVDAYHHGMITTDTLWYHMPFAARFVQQGTITPLHYVDAESVTVFFPATSELFHSLGIMFMGNDLLSPLINPAWMAVALLAAWCVGRPFGVAPVTLTAVTVLLATPGLVATQPGGAYDDVVGLAMLLSCAALLVTGFAAGGAARLTSQCIAAVAAGVALGTKLTFIAPVAALTVGVVVLARRGRRLREGGVWLLLLALTGGFWYVRNLIIVGNPLPTLNLKLGPLALPSPPAHTPSSTVAHFLFNGSSWRTYLLPGLRLSFGPAWWALFALAGAGLVLVATTEPNRTARMLAWVGLATAAAFVVTPQYLAILGAPVFFVDNVRYVDPAVAFGLVLLPLSPMLLRGRRPWWLLGGYGAILVGTQLDRTIWPLDLFTQRFADPIRGIDSFIGLTLGVAVLGVGLMVVWLVRAHPRGRSLPVAAVVTGVALLVSGFGLQQFYLRNRYQPAVGWAQSLHNARIAVAGATTQLQYQYYGRDLTNYVQYVAKEQPHHGYAPIVSCSQWRRLVNAGHYDYVLTSTGLVSNRRKVFRTPFSYTVWTGADPASSLIRRDVFSLPSNPGYPGSTDYVGFSLFRLHGKLDPAACASPNLQKTVPTQP